MCRMVLGKSLMMYMHQSLLLSQLIASADSTFLPYFVCRHAHDPPQLVRGPHQYGHRKKLP